MILSYFYGGYHEHLAVWLIGCVSFLGSLTEHHITLAMMRGKYPRKHTLSTHPSFSHTHTPTAKQVIT